jgi:hypothetical protein
MKNSNETGLITISAMGFVTVFENFILLTVTKFSESCLLFSEMDERIYFLLGQNLGLAQPYLHQILH